MFRLTNYLAAALLFTLAVPASAQDKDKKDPPKAPDVAKPGADKDKKDPPKPGDPAKPGADKDKKDPPKPGDPAKPDKDKKDPPKPVDPPKDNNLVKAGILNGEVAHVESGKQTIRVKYTITYTEPNRGEIDAVAAEQRAMAIARAKGDINDYQNHYRAMLQHQAKIVSVKTKTEEVTLDAAENLQIRLNAPKPGFDEMGNIKKYTSKELAKLRGKDGKYDGEFSDLMPGQLVSIQSVKPKNAGKPVKPDDLNLDDNKPKASVILVVAQPKAG